MSLPDYDTQRSFFEADQLYQGLFDRHPGAERFTFFSKHVLPQLQTLRPKLEAMYCVDNGRPGEEPVLLLGTLLLQFMERKPDRQATECCVFDLRWKLALGMEADAEGFHPTTLVKFRQRLIKHGLEDIGFDAALEAMHLAGYLGSKSKRQRVDSSHVIGLVSRMSRLENVRETIRLALESIRKQSTFSESVLWHQWWERYVENKPDFRVDKAELQKRFNQAGKDAAAILAWAKAPSQAYGKLKAVELLSRVFEENFEINQEDESCSPLRAQPAGAVQNPHDPQAQWSSKSTTKDKEWVGYKVQVSETVSPQRCEKGEPTSNVITAIVTQPAISSDKAALPEVEEHWEEREVEKPDILFVDGGYTSGHELARAQKEERELMGPMAPSACKNERFRVECFDVSVEERKAICPAGHKNAQCSKLTEKKTGKINYRIEFSWKNCEQCSLKEKCLAKDQKHRTITVQEHHTLMQARRREQQKDTFKKEMEQRNGIEGTISELVRAHGMRRSRYRGEAKTRLQNFMIGAACNIRRWCARTNWEKTSAVA